MVAWSLRSLPRVGSGRWVVLFVIVLEGNGVLLSFLTELCGIDSQEGLHGGFDSVLLCFLSLSVAHFPHPVRIFGMLLL